MQDHEKTILELTIMGGADRCREGTGAQGQLTIPLVAGRATLGSSMSTVAGIVLRQIPDLQPIALLGLGSVIDSTKIATALVSESEDRPTGHQARIVVCDVSGKNPVARAWGLTAGPQRYGPLASVSLVGLSPAFACRILTSASGTVKGRASSLAD
ncbi:hypothetical protein [Burkholderia sp. D-99]|uniref:hypothetical protein n=1 Tax=Burkholderia sp. D-99 TaxID=2717316 RepID=UPI001AA1C9F6|nr:hypothetical protein [Burkholderia sp. D-99]